MHPVPTPLLHSWSISDVPRGLAARLPLTPSPMCLPCVRKLPGPLETTVPLPVGGWPPWPLLETCCAFCTRSFCAYFSSGGWGTPLFRPGQWMRHRPRAAVSDLLFCREQRLDNTGSSEGSLLSGAPGRKRRLAHCRLEQAEATQLTRAQARQEAPAT